MSTDKLLYRLVIPADAQTRSKTQVQRQVSSQSVLTGGAPDAESIGMQPGDILLTGQYRAKYADKMAREVEELFNASRFSHVPFYDRVSGRGGFYAMDNVSVEPTDPREERLQSFDGLLTEKGSRRSHYTGYEYNVTDIDHPFGSGSTDTTAYVAVPSTATSVWWYDESDGTRTDPSGELVETRVGEYGSVDIYDAGSAPSPEAALIYDLEYGDVGLSDCRVWDDRGVSKTDSDGILAWQKTYSTTHEYTGVPVIENDLFRAIPDPSSGFEAYEWDSGSSSWTSIALGTSDWSLADWDTRKIGPTRVEAVSEWEDTTQSPTATYRLRSILHRGWNRIQFDLVEGSAVPGGLIDLLSPVAAASIKDPGTELGLVKRSEVN